MSNAGRRIIEHFSHEHPLIFNEEETIDPHDVKPEFCSTCGVLILINSYYSCTRIEQGCHFFVHQQCVDGLPKELFVTAFDVYIFNRFVLSRPNNLDNEYKKCLKCAQLCKNYTYSRFDIEPKHIQPLCLVPLEIVTKHRSHNHPLAPTRREICGVCDACGEEERGVFLSCQTCDYWIYQECALLPPIAMHTSHSHPLVLFYTDNIGEPFWVRFMNCDICLERIIPNSFYTCRSCQRFFHLKCIKSSIKNIAPEELRKLTARLPASTEDTVFSGLIINLEQDDEVDATSTSMTTSMPKEFHEHPLIFREEIDDDLEEKGEIWGSKPLCNACINPISSTPYYSCSVIQCHFLVHEFCAKLPSRIQSKCYYYSTWSLFTKPKEFFSLFRCQLCHYMCNGFGYSIKYGTNKEDMYVDVECASVPRIIKHDSHKNHYLHLAGRQSPYPSKAGATTCCSIEYFSDDVYECISCVGYRIHVRCSLLPRTVRHKFDKHPFQLITNGGNLAGLSIASDRKYLENCGICEVCENLIDPAHWFYYCTECDQYLHVNCIPSVGKLSKIKFGGTLDHVGCHDHPVTSVRMLTIGSQTCAYCTKTVHGFKDDIAFHCEPCDVWIHYECARECTHNS